MRPSDPGESTSPDALSTRGRVLVHAAKCYDAVQPLVTLGQENKLNRHIAAILPVTPGAHILDVGCGTGLLTYAIACQHPSCQVVGIDASKPMLAVARRKRATATCSYRQAVAEALPFDDAAFDVVTSALFFHHVDARDKQRSLEEAMRVLKPSGHLYIADIGRPYTVVGWCMAYAGYLVLRQPEIKENMDGVLEELIHTTGYEAIQELGRFSGYIRLWSARKGLT